MSRSYDGDRPPTSSDVVSTAVCWGRCLRRRRWWWCTGPHCRCPVREPGAPGCGPHATWTRQSANQSINRSIRNKILEWQRITNWVMSKDDIRIWLLEWKKVSMEDGRWICRDDDRWQWPCPLAVYSRCVEVQRKGLAAVCWQFDQRYTTSPPTRQESITIWQPTAGLVQ